MDIFGHDNSGSMLRVVTEFGDRKRKTEGLLPDPLPINKPRDLFNLARAYIKDQSREEAFLVIFDGDGYGSQAVAVKRIGIGNEGSVAFSPVTAAWLAASHDSKSFALFHNHPDGNVSPSTSDQVAVIHTWLAANKLGLNLADSLIITPKRFLSMELAGYIPDPA